MEHETKPPVIHLSRPIPTANSTIPELISYLRSAHHKDSFDLVTKILLAREENSNNSAKEMSMELVNRNKELELIENKQRQLVSEKVSIEDELKKCKTERDGAKDELKNFRFECGELREKLMRSEEALNLYVGREKRADERYEKLVEDYKEAESRLRGEKSRSEAETVTWKKKYHDLVQKILKLEEYIGGLVEDEGEELLGVDSSGNNHDNGRAINKQFVLDSRSPSQMMAVPILGNCKREIIELDDSDDDKPNGNGIPLTTTNATEPGAKETCGKLRSSQTGEEDKGGCKETTTHSMLNAKRASSSEILETDIGPHKMRRLQEMGHEPKVSSSSFDTSDLGDKSLMDSFMEELVGNPQGERKCEEAWKYETDMLQAFEKDYEICMNAVCAIYRQQKSKEKSSNPLMPCSNQGIRHFDVLSGTRLAELLIDGDPEGKLRKSVSDLQLNNRKALDECRKIAKLYTNQLFQIYKSKKDPFFFPY